MDVGDEIYILRNSGSVSVAKEYVPAPSPSFAAIENDPQRLILTLNASSEKSFPPDAPSPQSSPRKRGEAEQRSPVTFDDAFFICSMSCAWETVRGSVVTM